MISKEEMPVVARDEEQASFICAGGGHLPDWELDSTYSEIERDE